MESSKKIPLRVLFEQDPDYKRQYFRERMRVCKNIKTPNILEGGQSRGELTRIQKEKDRENIELNRECPICLKSYWIKQESRHYSSDVHLYACKVIESYEKTRKSLQEKSVYDYHV
jgi:hypothetical protein